MVFVAGITGDGGRGSPGAMAGGPRFLQDPPEITDCQSAIKLADCRSLIAENDSSRSTHFPHSDSGAEMTPEIEYSYSRLWRGRIGGWSGGELAKTPLGPPEIAEHSSVIKEVGRPDPNRG